MRRFLLCCCSLCACLALNAQTVGHPGVQRTLSSDNTTALVRDNDGYIWIGTQRGLNRFNGSTYKIWYQDDENGLSDDYVTALCPDTDGRIWVGTSSGIELIRRDEPDPSARVILSRINALAVEDERHLLYATVGGIGRFDKETHACQEVYTDRRMIYPGFIRTSDRRLWINHTTRPILTILDERFSVVRELELQGRVIKHYEDGLDGSVYVCTDGGILRYTTDGQRMELPEAIRSLTDGKDILFYTKGKSRNAMLLGIRGEGIWILEGGRLTRIWEQETLRDTYSCRVCIADRNIWLSKSGQGLTWGALQNFETTFRLPQGSARDALNMFYAREDGRLLIVTNRGVYLTDPQTGVWTDMDPGHMFGQDQLGITLIDRSGDLWILHNYQELRRYGIAADKLFLKDTRPVLPSVAIWEDAETDEVCLLQGDRVLRISPDGAQRVSEVRPHPEFWFSGTLRSGKVFFLSSEDIWLLGEHGNFSRLDCDIKAPGSLYEDIHGKYWIGSRSQGVFLYDPETGKTSPVTLGSSESDHSVRSITGDDAGNIWIATRFDATLIPTDTGRLQHFRSANLGTYTFNTNSAAAFAGGSVWFGAIDRLIGFRADENAYFPILRPRIDEVLVNNTQVFRSVPDCLTLDHNQTQISIYFSAMNFNPVLQPVYQYMLEGLDSDWIFGGDNLRAGYSRLRSGKYTFRVRVMQADGTWSPDELVQPIRIKAAPWASRTAFICYLLLAILTASLLIHQFIRFRINSEKLDLAEEEKLLVEQMSQERTTFFTNVSHEFRTPLSLIYGPVKELGQSESLGEHERELVGLIERNSERMVRLTDQLLHFNRSSDELDSLSILRTDLSAILRKILENFNYMFSQKNLRVKTVIPQELIAYCDREKIEKIVFNLISNAIKYTPEHGEITVQVDMEDGKAILSVADTGIGISPDKMNRIFERYARLGEQVSGGLPSGFGIGLHYAQHLAQVHKGVLSVRANDPIGSVFTFVFPYTKEAYSENAIWQEEEARDENAAAGDTPSESVGRINVLVVEDNPDMREYVSGFLRDEHAVTIAGDGEEAWKLIRISTPDLIVSDVMMPYKDGYTLCKELKNDPDYCHIPIILLTAKADMDNQIHGLDLGADAYIGKPFDPSFFTTVVRNLLANRRRMQQVLGERTSATSEPIAEEAMVGAQDKAFLDKLYRIIDEHISDEEFNVTVLSMEMGMSRTNIFSKLKALIGQSPQTFLTNYRLNRAMELLKTREYNVSEVAYKVGFSTLTGFSRSFKNKFGVPPSSI